MNLKNITQIKDNEKLVFKISLVFWRILVALAGLGVVVGLLMFLWGMTPSLKPGVSKDKYPQPVAITYKDIYTRIIPEKEQKLPAVLKIPGEVASKEGVPVEQAPPAPLPGKAEYEALLDSLKSLIPPAKYSWKNKGHWEYPYGEYYWKRHRESSYRRWKVDRLGITGRLKSAYRKVNAENFVAKKSLLESYVAVVDTFPEKNRAAVLRALTTYPGKTVSQSIANVQLLSGAIPNFALTPVDYLYKLAVFGKKNPSDGRAFIEFANRTLNQFDPEIRFKALQSLISRYYKYFNNRISQQVEITDSFLPMLTQFAPEYQVAALENYYKMYLKRNHERMANIEQIDYRYERERSQAGAVLRHKQAAKTGWRLNGVYAIGGGIVVIAFLALVLALLSIQRNLERVLESVETSG